MKKRSTNEQNSISINDHKNYKLQIIHHNNNLKYIASHQKTITFISCHNDELIILHTSQAFIVLCKKINIKYWEVSINDKHNQQIRSGQIIKKKKIIITISRHKNKPTEYTIMSYIHK